MRFSRLPDGYVNGGISAKEQLALMNITGYMQLVEQRIGGVGQSQGSLPFTHGSADQQAQGHQHYHSRRRRNHGDTKIVNRIENCSRPGNRNSTERRRRAYRRL